MARLENDRSNRAPRGQQQHEQPQHQDRPLAPASQKFESYPRRPQNFDDSFIWRRDDDPNN